MAYIDADFMLAVVQFQKKSGASKKSLVEKL
jgi:hypothetical protein